MANKKNEKNVSSNEKKITQSKEKAKEEVKEETKEEKVVFKSDNKKKSENNSDKTDTKPKKEEKPNEIAKAEVLEEKENNKRKIIIILIVLIIVLAVILVFSTIFAFIHSTTGKITSGVKVGNVDVSGLTYEEANNKLEKSFDNVSSFSIDLNFKDNEYSYTIDSKDIDFACNFTNQLDEAYSVGRKGNIVKSNYSIILTNFIHKNFKVDYKYNEDILNSIVNDVSKSVPGIISQYSYYIEGDELIINPGTDGVQVQEEKLKEMIENSILNRDPSKTNSKNIVIEIPYKEVKADPIDMEKIYNEVQTEPKDASYTPATETEKAKIFKDIDGIECSISLDEAKAKLAEQTNEYIIPITRKKANITINDIGLEAFPDKLQEFSTRYDASLYGRSENLRIATSKIDGTVLMPGEQFSFNEVVGERTVQEGYKNAAIYSGDGVEDGLAGGICQISSTLYNVALLANLQIDERYNHSFKPTYVEAGRDATVVYGVKDFKFTNTRSYPIKIEGDAENGVVTFSLFGIYEDVEYNINITSKINETFPYSVRTVQDSTLAPGQQVIKQIGATGYKSTTYKETILNGAIINKEVISTDTYKAMERIIRVGPEM